MGLWDMLRGPRAALKKVRFIYEPYRKAKVDYVLKKRNQYLNENGMQLVLEIDKALEAANARFFVDGGTLLGLVRSGKLIQWDLDIDFGIFISQDFSWKDLEMTMNKSGFILDHQFSFDDAVVEQTYRRGVASVDFFGHFNHGDNTCFYSFYKEEGYVYEETSLVHTAIFKTRLITGMKVINVDGGVVHAPTEAEDYLEDVYGENWRFPDPNWKPHSGPSCTELGDTKFGVFATFN